MKNRNALTQIAANWWGEMMVVDPLRRKEFSRQLETKLQECEKTASVNEAVFVLGVGHRPSALLAMALENAKLTENDLIPIDPDDPIYMYLDFGEGVLDVQTGYRAAVRRLFPS